MLFTSIILCLCGLATASPIDAVVDGRLFGTSPTSAEPKGTTEPFSAASRSNGVLSSPLHARAGPSGVVSLPLRRMFDKYITEFGVGSPPQQVSAVLDCKSSEFWVLGEDKNNWQVLPVPDSVDDWITVKGYNPKDSITSSLLGTGTFYAHGGETGTVEGDWISDAITVGDVALSELKFGVSRGRHYFGMLGVGYEKDHTTQSLPLSLKSQGHIKQAAYSTYLSDLYPLHNTIMFGGVDASKFVAPLTAVPFADPSTLSIKLAVESEAFVATLDLGSTFSYFPQHLLSQIVKDHGLNLIYHPDHDVYVSKEDPRGSGNIVLSLGRTSFSIPVQDLFLFPTDGEERNEWTFGLMPVSEGHPDPVLGSSLLRNLYMVVNFESAVAAFAPLNSNPGAPNIVPITNGTIPFSVGGEQSEEGQLSY